MRHPGRRKNMFLKKTVLKRLMKEAYKHGLRVAATEERYYLCGGYWEMDILKKHMPKEILAAVLELTGWIPETGESYCATKEGNQVDINRKEVSVDAEEEIAVTDLTIDRNGISQRILQDECRGNILLIHDRLIDIVDNTEIEGKKGECTAEGPFYRANDILYENNVMRWHVCARKDERKDSLLKELSKINLMEEDGAYGMYHR